MKRFPFSIPLATLALMVVSPIGAASDDLSRSLVEAIEDEYRAEAYYTAVMAKFGEVRPFSNIVRAERMHSGLVAGLIRTQGFKVPDNRFLRREKESEAEFIARMAVPPTLIEAARQAADVERAQGPFYDRFLAQTDLPEDVRTVFVKLRADSLERHLPAFERFASGNGGGGFGGRGAGRRSGGGNGAGPAGNGGGFRGGRG